MIIGAHSIIHSKDPDADPALTADMKRRGIACAPVRSLGWGLLTQIPLPGGGKIGVYLPRHARPRPMTAKKKNPGARATRRAEDTCPHPEAAVG